MEKDGPLMQVPTTFATDFIAEGGSATGIGSSEDMFVRSQVVVAIRSDVGRDDGGALSVGRIGVKGASVLVAGRLILIHSKEDRVVLALEGKGRSMLCLSPRFQSDQCD